MNIKGKKVILRAIEKKDLEMMREMLNNPEIEDKVIGWSFPISSYQEEKWFEENIKDDTNLRFIIENEEKKAVGIVTLIDIDWKNRKAFHGIKLLGEENRGRGYGTDAVMAIMRYAFDELQLNRLDGNWFKGNEPSINLYKKCGWKEEGVRRKYIYKRGEYRDLVVCGILAEEYYTLINENGYWNRSAER